MAPVGHGLYPTVVSDGLRCLKQHCAPLCEQLNQVLRLFRFNEFCLKEQFWEAICCRQGYCCNLFTALLFALL